MYVYMYVERSYTRCPQKGKVDVCVGRRYMYMYVYIYVHTYISLVTEGYNVHTYVCVMYGEAKKLKEGL